MAIIKDSGEAAAHYPKKKKREEAWQPKAYQPVTYDPENRAAAITRAYYKKTGKLPSAPKLYAFVDKTKGPGFQSQEDFDSLFPDWVAEVGDDEDDIAPLSMFIDPSRETFRDMQLKGRIMSPRERERIAARKPSGTPEPELPPGVEKTKTEVQKAEAGFHLEKGAGTDFFYSDLSNRELTQRFSPMYAQRKILDPADAMMDPALITAARKEYGGKQRDDLTVDQRLRLDELAQKLAFTYGPEFSGHFAYDTKNVVWDDFFDAHVARYIVEGNLSYALLKSPGDPAGEMRKIAMRNIFVATNGRIREDTPTYELIDMMGSKGDPLNPLRVQDEYAEMLFAGFYNARRGDWSEREAAIAYVADFGEEMLPPSMKRIYDSFVKDFKPHIARAQMAYTQAGLAAAVAAEHPEWAGIDPKTLEVDPMADVQLVKEAVLDTVLGLVEAARGEKLEDITVPVETTEEYGPTRFTEGRVVEEERIPEGRVGGRAVGQLPSEMRSDYIHSKLMREIILPMAGVEETKEGWGDVLLSGVDRAATAVSLLVNIGTMDMLQEMGFADRVPSSEVVSAEEAALMKQYGIDDDYSFRSVWELSGALTHKYKATTGPKAFQHRMWQAIDETYGTHTVDNGWLQGISEFTYGLALDALLDKGVGLIIKGVKTGGIAAIRAAKAEEGYKVVKGVKAGVAATEGVEQATWRLIRDPSKPSTKLLRRMGFKSSAEVTFDSVKAWIGRQLLSGDWRKRVADMEDANRVARARIAGGGISKKEAASLADEIAERENTIKYLDTRPLWYDSVAEALARDTQSVPFMYRFFHISDDGLGWAGFEAGGKAHIDDVLKVQQQNAIQGLLRQAGKSRNADEIFGILTDLGRRYGIKLDPGADMLGKLHYYNLIANAHDGASAMGTVLPPGIRLEEGVNTIYEHMASMGHLTNMGCRKGDQTGLKQLAKLMDEVAALKGSTYSELAQGRQRIWAKMWDQIDDNLKARPVSKSERRAIEHLKKVSGVQIDVSKVNNRLDLYKAVQKIKKGGKWLRGSEVARDARMYFPKEQIDEAAGVVRIVEGSKVTRKPIQIAVAEVRHKKAEKAFTTVAKAHKKGKSTGMELENAKRNLEEAQTHLRLVRQAEGALKKAQPFLEGQLAKDLICRYNPHELAVFNSAFMKTDTLFHLGVFYGRGPSLHGASVAFRTFVLGTLGFGVKMALSDEFWRMLPEGVWKTLIGKNGEYRAALKTLAERKSLNRAITNNLADLMRSSDAWVAVTPDADDYPLWLNSYIEFLRDNERSVDMLLRFPRQPGMTDEVYRAHLIDEINKLVLGTSREGQILREHLKQMGRLPRHGYRTPRGLKAESEAWEREAQAAEDEYGRAWRALDDNRERQEHLAKRVGPLGKPTKEYEVAWLRQKYTQTLREQTEVPVVPKTGKRGGRLKTRKPEPPPRKVLVEREWTDDEVLALVGDRLKDKSVKRAIKADYHRYLARRRKHSRAYEELLRLKREKTALKEQQKAALKKLNHYEMSDAPGLTGYADDPEYLKWLEDTIDNLLMYETDEVLRDALLTGRKLSKREVKDAVVRMREQGKTPPTVIGVHTLPRFGEGYIPGFSEFAEWGPFKLVDKISNMMRKATFAHYQMKYYDDFIKQGMNAELAYGRACHYALRETDRAMYTHNMTVFEYMTKDIILFQPAYRQFVKYWGALWAKHPFLMTGIRNDIAKDYPAVRIPGTDFETMLPMPFWAQGDFTDAALPGVGPLIILPLRVANYATGWTWDDDEQKYIYTGATDLDWVSDIAPLSFMSKNSSMMTWMDDILYGLFPSSMSANPQDNWMGKLLASARMSPFKDPVKRQQLTMNILNAQIAAGAKPDWTKAVKEMKQEPGWWKLLETFAVNPDAILSGVSRVANPFTGRIWYEPGDENVKLDDAPFWERWSGSTPRTMADAHWEFMNAYGDEKKMREVLEKFPGYAEIQRFWDMTVEERSEYLAKHPNIIPYITSKYFYEDGLPLVGGEFWIRLKENGIYRRNLDSYIENMQQVFLDTGFSASIRKAEKDFKDSEKEVDAFVKEAIDFYAKGNKLLEDNLRYTYDKYKNEWQTPEPGTTTTSMQRTPPQFLVNYARIKGIEEDIFKWDIGAVQKRMDDTYLLTKDGGKRLQALGLTANKYGVEDRWTHKGIYAKGDKFDKQLGAMRGLSDTLTKYVSPHYRSLVNMDGSAYWPDIRKQLKAHDDYNWSITKKLVTGAYYEIPNSAALAAIGVPMTNRKAIDNALVDINVAYWTYRAKSEGLDTWDDAYKAARAEYIAERNRILSKPGLESLAGGPASRAFYVLGNGGRGVSKNFLSHVVAEMKKENPNYGAIAEFWMDRNPWSESFETKRERAAWASLAMVAMEYRKAMKQVWNEQMDSTGTSPKSKLGKSYLRKLENYAILWGRIVPEFKKKYNELGGAELLTSMLDPNY